MYRLIARSKFITVDVVTVEWRALLSTIVNDLPDKLEDLKITIRKIT